MCNVLSYNIELYRQTTSAVGEEPLSSMTPAARERALQREMRACGHLHVAFKTPEGHYKVRGCSKDDTKLTQSEVLTNHVFSVVPVGLISCGPGSVDSWPKLAHVEDGISCQGACFILSPQANHDVLSPTQRQ